MKRSTLPLFAVLLATCILAGPVTADDAAWIQLQVKKYGFQVMMPEQPEEVMNKQNYYVGEVTNHIYTAKENDQIFKVDYTDLPHLAVRFVGEADIMDQTRAGVLRKWIGKQVSYTDTTMGKLKGKMLVYETAPTDNHPGMKGEAIFFLKGHELYLAEVITPKSQLPGNAKKFLDSFKIE